MADTGRFIEDKGIMPWETPPEMGWPDMTEIGQDVHANVRDTLQRVPQQKTSAKPRSFEGTLKDFMDSLKDSKDPNAKRKLEIIDTERLFLSKHFNVDTTKVRIQKLPGNTVGKAEGDIAYVDPCLFNNKAFTDDDFTEVREDTLGHELTHIKWDIDHEGLTSVYAAIATGASAMDYEDDVHNTSIITNLLGDGNNEKGCVHAIDLYTTGRYDDLYAEFSDAYTQKHPDKVENNKDVPLRVFQLAFPKLKLAGEGTLVVDEEMINDVSGEGASDESGNDASGESDVEGGFAMAA